MSLESIATEGFLTGSLELVATYGYLDTRESDVEISRGGGGSGSYIDGLVYEERLRREQILREDEEIVLFIKTLIMKGFL